MAGLASEQALAALTTELLTNAASLDDAALDAVGVDLSGVAGVLGGEPSLRRMLTEATTEQEARIALATRVFEGKIGAGALSLLLSAVGRRWSSGREMVDGLVRLSRTAVFVRAERAGVLDDVEDQLFRFGRIVDAHPDLAMILDDPATSAEGRADLVGRLLADRTHPLTLQLVTDLAKDTSGRSFSHGVAELVTQAADRRDKLVAIATSAVALSTDETDRLRAALQRIYSHPVAIHVIVDATLRGGLTVRVGDEVIDGSISGRLTDIRQRLSRR